MNKSKTYSFRYQMINDQNESETRCLTIRAKNLLSATAFFVNDWEYSNPEQDFESSVLECSVKILTYPHQNP